MSTPRRPPDRQIARLAVMDLRALGVKDGSTGAYLSLGVVEHDP